jgi:hypothetical protein
MSDASPRTWRIEGHTIWDADGGCVVSALNPCDMPTRRLIVDAVNANGDTPGNAAALREALTQLLAWLDAHGDSYTYLDGTPTDEVEAIWQRRQEIVSQARAALAAPPRNCDRFANTAQALGAYPDGPPVGDDWDDADWMMLLDWLFAKAKEAKK